MLSFSASAQTALVEGKIVSVKGEPVENVNVYISPKKWSISNESGNFSIPSVPFGNHSLTISSVGYQTVTKSIKITSENPFYFEIIMSEEIFKSTSLVVTATRTAQDIEGVPISVDVISYEEIQQSGSITLKDVLLEQAGISLAPDEENAIQLYGFESDYTLILVDGQPLIGRTRGALDANRINLSNIKQVEIIKGPSSALWGSDALAGVINIITKSATEPFSGSLFANFGSRSTYNFGGDVSFLKNKLSGVAGIAFDGSDGFDLSDSEFGKNLNPYQNFIANTSLTAHLSELSSITVLGRYFIKSFSGLTLATVEEEEIGVDENGWQDDLSFSARFETTPISQLNTSASLYSTRYEDYSKTAFEEPSEENIINNNRQGLDKAELQNNYVWENNHISTIGIGGTREFVNAERFQGRRTQHGFFAFAQHQLLFSNKVNLTLGARLDNHSTYNSYLSPKISLMINPIDNLSFKASLGRGFKAPDLRTLYLNFDNSGSGYRLLGTENIGAELASFKEQGLISSYFISPETPSSLSPEYSTSINIGASFKNSEGTSNSQVNFFRNIAGNLIDAVQVAELTDGNTIFGYVNIDKARTHGIEAQQDFLFSEKLRISLGYQYLEAVEIASESRTILEDGKVVTKDVEFKIPLPKRPLHSTTIKLAYQEPLFKTNILIRSILKSAYFHNDDNTDNQADSNEFTDPYSIWNVAISKQFEPGFRLQIGANNLLNYTNPDFLRYQPGLTLFTKIFFEF